MNMRTVIGSVFVGFMTVNVAWAGNEKPLPVEDADAFDDVEVSFDPSLAPPGAAPVIIRHGKDDREVIPPANPKLIVEPDGKKHVEIFGEKRPLSEIGIDVDGDHIVEMVRDKMDKTDAAETINVYVKIGIPLTDQVIEKIQSVVGKSVTVHPMREYGLNHVAVALTPGQLELLAKQPFVEFVEPAWGINYRFMIDKAREYTGVNYSHNSNIFCNGGINSTTCAINGDHDGSRWGYSSQDIVVAVMDTGINQTHSAFGGGKIVGWTDQTGAGEPLPVDPIGHGTHVASIIAGESNIGLYGVAPGAALVGVRIFNANGQIPIIEGKTAVYHGLKWILDNRATYNIKVVNLSAGEEGCYSSTELAEHQLINQLIDAGVTFIVAVGNNTGQPRYCQLNKYATVPRSIAVGNLVDPEKKHNNAKGWTIHTTSDWGPTSDGVTKPDVMAPGTCIMGAKATGTDLGACTASLFRPAGYIDYSGTSMSAPFVAGIAAGLLDANVNLTPAQIKSFIVDNAEIASGTANNNVYGGGYVRAFNTYKAVLGGSQTWDDGFDHSGNSTFSISQGTVVEHSFTRSDNTKHIHVTLVASKYGTLPGGQGEVAFRVRLYNPDGTLHSDTGSEAQPIKHLYRQEGGVTGVWKVKVSAVSAPNGWATYQLDVTEK